MKTSLLLSAMAMLATSALAQTSADTITLDDVVVTGSRLLTPTRHLPMTVTSIGRSQLTLRHHTSVLPTLVEQVPGLMVTSRGVLGYGVSGGAAGGISIRGIQSGQGQILVLIDGQPQYQGVYGHSISDAYQTMMAERVEVLRGPASVLYGSNAMGGVINVITRGMKDDGSRSQVQLGVGSYGTVQTEMSHQLRQGRFTSTVAAEYDRTDNHRPRMGFEQYGGHIKLGYDISSHWDASASLDLTHFNASHPGTVNAPMYEADQWITRGAAYIGLANHYERTEGRISVYDNFGRHKINDGYAEGKAPQTELFRSKDALAGISLYQTMHLAAGSSLTLGLDYQHIYGRAYYTSRSTGEVVTTGKRGMQSGHAHSNEVGAYVDLRQDICDWLTLDAGIRYDHHSVAGGEWVPQVGAVVRPVASGELKATVSKGFRNPTMKDMYLYAVANHDSLHAERLWSYELSWRQRLLAGQLSYGVSLFVMDGDNMIQTVAGRNVNTGEINNRGAEIDASWHLGPHWTLMSNHSFLHMRHHIVGAPEYKGYVGAQARYGAWHLAAGVMQLSGLFTAVGANEQRENATLVNATVRYNLSPTAHVWIKGDNLLSQRYEINAGYPMPRATVMTGVQMTF